MNGFFLGDCVIELVGKINEKIEFDIYEKLEVIMISLYIYMGNKVVVFVGMNKVSDDIYDGGCDVVMQVVVMKLVVVDKDGVDQFIIDKEIEIGKEQVCQEGKFE